MTSVRAVEGVGEAVTVELGFAELSAAIDAFASEMVSTGLGVEAVSVPGNSPHPLKVMASAKTPAEMITFFTPES